MVDQPKPPETERERIQRETLAQLRLARAQIDPTLLHKVRAAVIGAAEPEAEKVSRSHMLETVKGYLLLKRGDKSVSGALVRMLDRDK